jgi:hypothetical protein
MSGRHPDFDVRAIREMANGQNSSATVGAAWNAKGGFISVRLSAAVMVVPGATLLLCPRTEREPAPEPEPETSVF